MTQRKVEECITKKFVKRKKELSAIVDSSKKRLEVGQKAI